MMLTLNSRLERGVFSKDRRGEKIMSVINKEWAIDMEEDLLLLGARRWMLTPGCDRIEFTQQLQTKSESDAKTVSQLLVICETIENGLQNKLINLMRTNMSSVDFSVLMFSYGYNMTFSQIGRRYLTSVKKVQDLYCKAMLDMIKLIMAEQIDPFSGTIVTFEDVVKVVYLMGADTQQQIVLISDVAGALKCSTRCVNLLVSDLERYYVILSCDSKLDHEKESYDSIKLTDKGKGLAEQLLATNGVMHPGWIVSACVERQYDGDIAAFAEELALPIDEVTKLLECRTNITEQLAERLGKVFDRSATYWRLLQEMYDEFEGGRNRDR